MTDWPAIITAWGPVIAGIILALAQAYVIVQGRRRDVKIDAAKVAADAAKDEAAAAKVVAADTKRLVNGHMEELKAKIAELAFIAGGNAERENPTERK